MTQEPEPTYSADQAMIRRARSKYGSLGAMVAGGMLGLDKLLGRKAKEEAPIVWEAAGEPTDIDSEGISIQVDPQTSVVSHPHRSKPAGRHIRKRRSQG